MDGPDCHKNSPHTVSIMRIRVGEKLNHPEFHPKKLPSLGIASIHPSHRLTHIPDAGQTAVSTTATSLLPQSNGHAR